MSRFSIALLAATGGLLPLTLFALPLRPASSSPVAKNSVAPGVAAKKSHFTWARDIAPILEENCVVCHRKGDVGPFALDSYEQARNWAQQIKEATTRRTMPPWKAEPGHGEFLDSRRLTDEQIARIAEWADGETPMGNKKDRPEPPKRHKAGDWALGKPDVVARPTAPYKLDAEGADVYRNFALPVDFKEDRYVSAFDFRPGNRAIVHHIIAYIDLTGETVAKKEGKDGKPGWTVTGGGDGLAEGDWGDGWTPGMNPRRLPEGVAVKIPKGAKLVLQVHYHKSGKPETDRSEVAIYWAKQPVKHVLKTAGLGNYTFTLKPNVANQEVKAAMVVPFDATLRQVLPHMHRLGTEMRVWAKLPDGTEKPLIYVKDWDFNWQMNYRYKEPIKIPKGTRISLLAKFDNTEQNPNQPSKPPKEVRFGEQTTDEMCIAFLGFTRDTLPKADEDDGMEEADDATPAR